MVHVHATVRSAGSSIKVNVNFGLGWSVRLIVMNAHMIT